MVNEETMRGIKFVGMLVVVAGVLVGPAMLTGQPNLPSNPSASEQAFAVAVPKSMSRTDDGDYTLLRDRDVVVLIWRLTRDRAEAMQAKLQQDFAALSEAGNPAIEAPTPFSMGDLQGWKFKRVDPRDQQARQVQYVLTSEAVSFFAEIISQDKPFDEATYEKVLGTVRAGEADSWE
ncbi:hypothetical protein [Blastopirellula marina]|uniref:Uncharacterized protein n=1 Tax=Blastopirellula marina TaxID=124 RepID=A0A2S8F886_9BACT|nr:hypothetical protein [Blastopirellula marina]PQO28376.1 hypothetical protein C5Y98_26145 [Blastopirellula marina]PTL41916.1 hypothetical protein C5Y97_26160 [Blastopirellula marina]